MWPRSPLKLVSVLTLCALLFGGCVGPVGLIKNALNAHKTAKAAAAAKATTDQLTSAVAAERDSWQKYVTALNSKVADDAAAASLIATQRVAVAGGVYSAQQELDKIASPSVEVVAAQFFLALAAQNGTPVTDAQKAYWLPIITKMVSANQAEVAEAKATIAAQQTKLDLVSAGLTTVSTKLVADDTALSAAATGWQAADTQVKVISGKLSVVENAYVKDTGVMVSTLKKHGNIFFYLKCALWFFGTWWVVVNWLLPALATVPALIWLKPVSLLAKTFSTAVFNFLWLPVHTIIDWFETKLEAKTAVAVAAATTAAASAAVPPLTIIPSASGGAPAAKTS